MTRFILAALVAVFAFSTPASAEMYPETWQVPCSLNANELRSALAQKYGESRIMSTTDPERSFELWFNKETGTWTILFIHPSGKACAPLSGESPWVRDAGI